MNIYQPHEATRLCCIGVPGEGKSVYRAYYLSDIYRATLYNQMGDYHIGEVMRGADEYRRNMQRLRRGSMRVTVVPSTYDQDGMPEEYDALCAYVYEVGAMHFASEEIGLMESPTSVTPNFNMLCITGRHRAVSLSFYGQRFHQFPVIARGTASEIVAFSQTEPEDVRDFDKRIAPIVAPVPINQLPEHHYLYYNRKQGMVIFCKPIQYRGKFEEYKPKENLFSFAA